MSPWTWRVRFLAIVLAGISMPMTSALAVTFTVNSILDQVDDDTADGVCHTAVNTCTLRAAVMSANRASGTGATIILPALPAGPYKLTRPADITDGEDNGDLNFTVPSGYTPGPTTIIGDGAAATIIDANGIDRALTVDANRTVSISGVTLRNGFAAGDGGGIQNSGTIALSYCTIGPDNTTDGGGGGIANEDDSSLTLDHSLLIGNHAVFGGGLTQYKATADISYSTISGNTASGSGGGIAATYPLTIADTTISLNVADGNGGGINYSQGTAKISRSTISGNIAHLNGGGLYTVDDVLYVENSTIALNSSDGDGGGIYVFANVSLDDNFYNSTIAYNDADHDRDGGSGGGILVHGTIDNGVNLYNTVVAGNTMGNQPLYDDCDTLNGGTLKSHASNLFGTTDGCSITTISGSHALLDPLNSLGNLQNNGGPTQTIALLAGSNAIDGTISGVGCRDSQSVPIPVDQRGFARADGACDVGAFEYDDIFADGFN